MKRTLKHTAMLMLAALMFTACSKDDDNNNNINVDTSKNYVQYNGTNYTIGQSQLVPYEDWYKNGTYSYGIRLFIENSEEMVEVDFLLANSTIPEGSKTYNYSASHQAGTMDAFFYDIGNDQSSKEGTLTSGSAIISKNGNTYEISFNVKLPDGKTVLGHYKETIEEE